VYGQCLSELLLSFYVLLHSATTDCTGICLYGGISWSLYGFSKSDRSGSAFVPSCSGSGHGFMPFGIVTYSSAVL